MKNLFSIPILLLVLFSCSPEEETQAPTSTVQTTTPEPEPETPAPVLVQYTLEVTAGEGGSVTAGGTFDDGTSVSVTATANEGYEFIGWEGSDETTNNISITLNTDTSLNALFRAVVQYTLTITAGDGGNVTDGGTYDEGTEVTITATANDGYTFSGWDGSDSSENNITLSINTDVTLTANFVQNVSISIDKFEMVYPSEVKGIAQSEFESIFGTASAFMSSRTANILTIVYPLGAYVRDGGNWDGGFNTYETILDATAISTIRARLSEWFTTKLLIPANQLDSFLDEKMAYVIGGADLASHFGESSTARLVMIGVPNSMTAAGLKKTFIHETYHAFQQDLETDSCRDTEPPAASSNSGWLVEGTAEYFAHTVGESLGIEGASKSNFLQTALADYNEQLADNDDSSNTFGRNASKSAAAIHLMILKGYLEEAHVLDGSLFHQCARQGTYGPSNTDIPFIKNNWYKIISTNGIYSFSSDILDDPSTSTTSGASYSLDVTASNSSDYTLSGTDRNGNISGNDPDLTFSVGDTISFVVNASGHPFYLKTTAGTGTGNTISGITNNGTTNQTISWTPTSAGTFYYQCSLHGGMVGTITIQ